MPIDLLLLILWLLVMVLLAVTASWAFSGRRKFLFAILLLIAFSIFVMSWDLVTVLAWGYWCAQGFSFAC